MNRSVIDLWVGVFVVAGIAALLFLALKVGNLGTFSGGQAYQVYAKFANIGSLKARAPIKSAGVVVGRVSSVRFDNESYEAIVEMNLETNYQFPRDTTAKILTSGLLGEQYIGLEAGGDGVMLKTGDRLRLTQSAVVLENLISQFLFNKASEQVKEQPKEPVKEPAKDPAK
jgi:phospholipid/cholesterol/gamma-HCH transport system substrate-binding protein